MLTAAAWPGSVLTRKPTVTEQAVPMSWGRGQLGGTHHDLSESDSEFTSPTCHTSILPSDLHQHGK